MKKRLIRELEAVDLLSVTDLLYTAAYNAEDALMAAGAVPGEDYTYKDLFMASSPIANYLLNETELEIPKITFSVPLDNKVKCNK